MSARAWEAAQEKWMATQIEAFARYPSGHRVLNTLDDVLHTVFAGGEPGDIKAYCEAVYEYQCALREEPGLKKGLAG